MTTPEQWRAFLQQWSDEWLATDEPFPASVRRSRWLGFKPATEEQIEKLEHEFKDPRLAPIVLRVIDDEGLHVQARFGAAFALVTVSPETAADELIARLAHPSGAIRQLAATAVRQTGERRAIAPLRALLNDRDEAVRQQAEMSLRFLER